MSIKKNCQDTVFAITPEGDVNFCGRFCDGSVGALGNIGKDSLVSILEKKKQTDLYNRLEVLLHEDCKSCEYLNICNGGCPHDALSYSQNYMNKTFLCDAYKQIYSYFKNI